MPTDNGVSAHREIISVHLADLMQLFNPLDPSPFGQRDLDTRVEEFIVDWARESHRHRGFELRIHLARQPEQPDPEPTLGDAVRGFFQHRSRAARTRLRRLLQRGRISLGIGALFLTGSIIAGGTMESILTQHSIGSVLRESLLIGGWVAMWRPLEIFLYDWWPISAEARLLDRLGEMPVQVMSA